MNNGSTFVQDGDGQKAKQQVDVQVTYYLRSSVLGQTLAEIEPYDGSRRNGFVYADGQLIATQAVGAVFWRHTDPSGKSRRTTLANGDGSAKDELDPMDVKLDPPGLNNHNSGSGGGGKSAGGAEARVASLMDLNMCDLIGGLVVPCAMVESLQEHASSGSDASWYANEDTKEKKPLDDPNDMPDELEDIAADSTDDGKVKLVPCIGCDHDSRKEKKRRRSKRVYNHASRPQNSGFKLAGPGFSDQQMGILVDTLKTIKEDDCTNFINETLAKYKVAKEFGSLDNLLNRATFGYYDVNSDYTNTDLGVDINSTILLRDAFVNRGASAAGVGTHVFLSAKVFERSSSIIPIQSLNHIADTPGYIVHELFHVAGIDKSIVDSQQMTNAIREHCHLTGSDPITLRH